jgi:hypothetical protein
MRPKRAASGVAGLHYGSGQRKTNRALISETSAGNPRPEAIPLNLNPASLDPCRERYTGPTGVFALLGAMVRNRTFSVVSFQRAEGPRKPAFTNGSERQHRAFHAGFSLTYRYIFFLRFCPCNWGTQERADTAPKASGCFLGGTREIFDGFSEDLLGGTGTAEAAKLPGAGIIPKLCPMKRSGTEKMDRNEFYRRGRELELVCESLARRASLVPTF